MASAGGQRSSRHVALLAAAANLVVCAGIGTTLLLVTRTRPESALPAPPPTEITSTYATATTTSAEQTTDSGTPTTTISAQPDLTPVSGPSGITTVIPAGWTPAPTSSAGGVQATDPTDSTRYVRYGGSPAPATPILQSHLEAESQFAGQPDRPGYSRVALDEITVRGYPAVDWEFEWDAPEGRRHVHAVYWRAGGTEYFVYVSAKLADWPQYAPLLTAMLENSTP